MKRNALLLFPLLGACALDNLEVHDEAITLPPTKVCAPPNTTLHEAEDYTTLATLHQEFLNGGARLISATMQGTVPSSSDSATPMQGLRIYCTGPETRMIQTTENAIRGAGALSTKAELTITGPGSWDCELGGITVHKGADLALDSSQTCISSTVSDAQDWPHWPADTDIVGLGQRIRELHGTYVFTHDWTLAPDVATFGVRANMELTDIDSDASGTSIATCMDSTADRDASAFARLYVQAQQRSTTGYCGPRVYGPEIQVPISPQSHHKKVYPKLDNVPVSNALGCLPTFEVKVFVQAMGGGNALCFHAARYSNMVVVPQSYDGPVIGP